MIQDEKIKNYLRKSIMSQTSLFIRLTTFTELHTCGNHHNTQIQWPEHLMLKCTLISKS